MRGQEAIGQAVDGARAFGEAQRLEIQDLARLCIVVEELVANLYDHGGLTEADQVEIVLAGDVRGIRVSITDPGMPFNPWSTQSAAENGKGGAGVRLIQAWAELVSYRSSSDGNHLELLVPARRDS